MTVIVEGPDKVTVEIPFAIIPVTAFPDALTLPFIVNVFAVPVAVIRTPVELSPETSTSGVTPVAVVPVAVPFVSFKKTPILFVNPVPKTFTDPTLSTVEFPIPTIPVPFLILVLLIFPVFAILAPFANIPIA